MDPALNQALIDLLAAVAVALVALISYFGKQVANVVIAYLKMKLGVTAFESLKSYADTVVHSLEQQGLWDDLVGDEKKARAMSQLINYAKERGITVTEDDLDHIIEEAVHIMNMELGKFEPTLTVERIVGEAEAETP